MSERDNIVHNSEDVKIGQYAPSTVPFPSEIFGIPRSIVAAGLGLAALGFIAKAIFSNSTDTYKDK